MKGKLLLLAGAAVGYVFGTRAGRERYEQIRANVNKAWNDPRVQEKVTEAEHFVNDTAKHKLPEVQERLSETARGAMGKAKAKFGNGEEHDHDETMMPSASPATNASTPHTPSGAGTPTPGTR